MLWAHSTVATLFLCVCFQMVCRFLCESKGDTLTDKQFVPDVRKFIVKQILAGLNFIFQISTLWVSTRWVFECFFSSGRLKYSEVLSSDLQKNALAALSRLGAVQKIKGSVLVLLTRFCFFYTITKINELISFIFSPQSITGKSEGQQGDGELAGRHSGWEGSCLTTHL